MDFWNAMSFGAVVGDAIGFNASQKAALQLITMQPDKTPQKPRLYKSTLNWTRRRPKHWSSLNNFRRNP